MVTRRRRLRPPPPGLQTLCDGLLTPPHRILQTSGEEQRTRPRIPEECGVNDRSRPWRSPNTKKGRYKRGKGKRRRRQNHGTQWRSYKVRYRINVRASNRRKGRCLVDRGANGCIIGSDMSIVDCINKYIDLTGIEDHTVRELNIVNTACVAVLHLGPIILEIGQGAHMPDAKLIISPLQLKAYG